MIPEKLKKELAERVVSALTNREAAIDVMKEIFTVYVRLQKEAAARGQQRLFDEGLRVIESGIEGIREFGQDAGLVLGIDPIVVDEERCAGVCGARRAESAPQIVADARVSDGLGQFRGFLLRFGAVVVRGLVDDVPDVDRALELAR